MSLLTSFSHAVRGLGYVLRLERNARIHLFLAMMALVLGLVLDVSNLGLAAIFFAIVLVFLAEIMNTAIEKTLDLIDLNHNGKIKLIKDMAAGAVLVTSVAALIIGTMILAPPLMEVLWPVQ